MRRAPGFPTSIALASILFSIIRPSSSQLVGCEAEGHKCSTDDSDGKGICQNGLLDNGIGVVSFETNTTADGPLTWTVTQSEESSGGSPFIERQFWLGTPPSMNSSSVDGFGGCAMVMANMTSVLQPPQGYDFSDFNCGTVMGDCAEDILSTIREELSSMVRNGTTSDDVLNPCELLSDRLGQVSLPESCQAQIRAQPFVSAKFLFSTPVAMIDKGGFGHQLQDGCVATSGGPDYLMNLGPQATTFGQDGDPALFKTGTTPLLTLFYNEPFNTTGSDAFLAEPEVHMSCLTIVPPAERSVASTRTAAGNSGLFAISFSLFGLVWVSVGI